MRNGDARALLSSAVRFRLDERVRDRIVAETRGNPLALLELPRGLTATQLAGGFGLLEAQALSGRIEESFVRRLEPLCRRRAASAAARGGGAGRRSAAAAGGRPSGSDRAGCRRAAETRRAADDRRARDIPPSAGALGDVPVGNGRGAPRRPPGAGGGHRSRADPDRRAWHLAAAAAGPDEQVALELERSAGRAQARGGVAAAAAFLQRAVALTAGPGAARGSRAGRRAGELSGRRVRRGSRARWPRQRPGRLTSSSALGSTCCAASRVRSGTRQRCAAAAAEGRQAARAARPRARARDLPDAWGAAVFAGTLARRDVLLEISRAVGHCPPPGAPGRSTCCSTACPARSPRARRGATDAAASGDGGHCEHPGEDVAALGWAAPVAAAGAVGRGGLACDQRRDRSSSCVTPARSPRCRSTSTSLAIATSWLGDFAGARLARRRDRERGGKRPGPGFRPTPR